jgi:hypothetical protein
VRRESLIVKGFGRRALGSPTFHPSRFLRAKRERRMEKGASLGKEAVLAALRRAGEKSDFFSILLVQQFGFDSVEEGLHLKGLLKRAVGTQHFGDVEKIENANHVTAAGDRDDFHVREFPP